MGCHGFFGRKPLGYGDIFCAWRNSTATSEKAKKGGKPALMIKQLEEALEDIEKLLQALRSNIDKKTFEYKIKRPFLNMLELKRNEEQGTMSWRNWTKAPITAARNLGHVNKNSRNIGGKVFN